MTDILILCSGHRVHALIKDVGQQSLLVRFSNCHVDVDFDAKTTGRGTDVRELNFFSEGSGEASLASKTTIGFQWKALPLYPEEEMENKIFTLGTFPFNLSSALSKFPLTLTNAGKQKKGLSNHELKQHIDHRLDTLGLEFSSLKEENEILKGQLAQVITNIASQVDPEYFKWIYIVLASGSVNKAASALKIPNSTFSKRLKDGAANGGLYQTLFNLTTKRKGCGVKSIEHYNPEFAAHQSSDFKTVDSVHELLDGLEALNSSNLKKMRDELIDLVKADFL